MTERQFSSAVVMLDMSDRTLHLPGPVHMQTKCGIQLDWCAVGPVAHLYDQSSQQCTACFVFYPTGTTTP